MMLKLKSSKHFIGRTKIPKLALPSNSSVTSNSTNLVSKIQNVLGEPRARCVQELRVFTCFSCVSSLYLAMMMMEKLL